MALVQKKISKGKQLRLAGALVLVIAVTLLVAYYGLIRRTPAAPYTPPQRAAQGGVSPFVAPSQTGYEAAFELSELPLFRKLRSFGAWPLSTEPKGRQQPFVLERPQEQ